MEGMLRRMPARWFLGWKAYYDHEPRGEERDDLRIALLTVHLVGALTGQRLKVDDCRLKFSERKAQTCEQMKLLLQMYVGNTRE